LQQYLYSIILFRDEALGMSILWSERGCEMHDISRDRGKQAAQQRAIERCIGTIIWVIWRLEPSVAASTCPRSYLREHRSATHTSVGNFGVHLLAVDAEVSEWM